MDASSDGCHSDHNLDKNKGVTPISDIPLIPLLHPPMQSKFSRILHVLGCENIPYQSVMVKHCSTAEFNGN